MRYRWYLADERRRNEMVYTFHYEIASCTDNRIEDVMYVQGYGEARARQYCEEKLEELYPGEEDWELLSLELVEVTGHEPQA
jgi:hypothetical protein